MPHLPTFKHWPADLVARNTRELITFYEQGFQGAFKDPEAEGLLYDEMEYKDFADVAFDNNMEGDGKGKLSLAYECVERLNPREYPGMAQRTGCCFIAGTKVYMADGTSKSIEDVQAGDLVLTHNSQSRRVVRSFTRRYKGELTTIKLKGYPVAITATSDHQFFAYPGIGSSKKSVGGRDDRRGMWMELSELDVGSRVLLPWGSSDHEQLPLFGESKETEVIDLHEECEFSKLTDDGDYITCGMGSRQVCNRCIDVDSRLGWLVGMYLAEGGTDGSHRVNFNLHRNETVIAKTIQSLLHEVFGVASTVVLPSTRPNSMTVRCNSKIITHFFRALVPGNQYTKAVPAFILRSSFATRIACMRGWLDGDGWFDVSERDDCERPTGKIVGVSCSDNLRRTMHRLSMSCGISSRLIMRKKASHQRVASGDLQFYAEQAVKLSPEMEQQGVKSHIVSRRSIVDRGMSLPISHIHREQAECDVYCLEVAGDHSFIAEGYAVHNCVSRGTVNAFSASYAYEVWNGLPDDVQAQITKKEISFYAHIQAQARGGDGSSLMEGWPVVPYPDHQTFDHTTIYGERGHRGQGANCGVLARAAQSKTGLVPRGKYDIPDFGEFDCSRYDDNKAARSGPSFPASFRKWANRHHVRDVTGCRELEAARDALANNYGMNVCSGFATSSRRPTISDNKGECAGANIWKGSWAHAMGWLACDDRDWAHSKYGGPLFLVMNSWGKWNSGPRRIYGTDKQIPEGAFWITYRDALRMLRGGGAYVLSNVKGFPRRPVFVDFW